MMRRKLQEAIELLDSLKRAVVSQDEDEALPVLVDKVCRVLNQNMLKSNPLFATTVDWLRERRKIYCSLRKDHNLSAGTKTLSNIQGDTQIKVTYEHKPAMTFIGVSTSIRPEESYMKCPEFWNKEYAWKHTKLWKTMKPETPVEKAW